MNSSTLFLLVGTFKEALQIPIRNWKLISSLTMITLLSYSFLFVSNIFCLKPLLNDLVIKANASAVSDPQNPEFAMAFRVDLRDIIGIESAFIFGYLTLSVFLITATISASSFIHRRKDLSLSELLPMTARLTLRPAVTGFCIILFGVGYTCLFVALFVILWGLILNGISFSDIALYILAMIFYSYLAVVWTLSLVVSVLEETCYGFEALGKAAKLAKGMKLPGLALNLVSCLVSIGLIQGLSLITNKQSFAVQWIIGMVVVNSLLLVIIFNFISYTVFYYQCKKSRGGGLIAREHGIW